MLLVFLAVKSAIDGQIKFKTSYLVCGHHDKLKQFMVHGSQTLQAPSARLIVDLTELFGFDIWSSYVKLAYLQSTDPLRRRVFISNPAPEFELNPNEWFELPPPLYGLCHAVYLLHQSLNKHLTEELGLEPTKVNPSLYFSFHLGELVGIYGTYFEDLLRAGDEEFRHEFQVTDEKYETSGDKSVPLVFA